MEVYGVDVGYGDVEYGIRINPRVQLLERTNLRYLDPNRIDHAIDLVTLDLSFISILQVNKNAQILLMSPGWTSGDSSRV